MATKSANVEGKGKGKRNAGEPSQGDRPTKIITNPKIGQGEFFNRDCLDKYLQLCSTKPLAIHPMDIDAFGENLPLQSLFAYQDLLSFLTPKYQAHYRKAVI